MTLTGSALASLVEEAVELPVEVTDARGRTFRQPIKVTIYRDDQRTKSPFLILNHGRSSDATKRQAVKAAQYGANARYLVGRGFTVLFLVRVGYGATGGPDVENSGPCNAKAYRPVYEAAAQQTVAAIEHAKSLSYVDPGKGLVMGQSFGGATAITLAAKNIPGILAAVNFAGGGGGRPDTHPEQPCGSDRMGELFASYGATARIPTLWLYSENDKYWGPTLPRSWLETFAEQGGLGQFVQLPPYKSDGHPIFTGNPEAWKPAFEAFLAACCKGAFAPERPARPSALSNTPETYTSVLTAWAEKHKVKRAIIVVRRDGRVVHQGAVGGADPAAPVLLASLSKAITGACIATLVRDGKTGFDWPLSRALARFFQENGRPADERIERATIGQLLTHRAGFSSAVDGEDESTGAVLKSYLENHSPRERPTPKYLSMVFEKRLRRDPGEAFAYSNAGYLALGAVIEEATGQRYEDYCREAVLKPVGAKAGLDSTWRVLWSFGGWRMAGADYLTFFDSLDPTRATFGADTRDWILDRNGKTYGKTAKLSWYSLGLRMRDEGRGLEYWHTGTFRRRLAPDERGPLSIETSNLAVHIADGTSWFMHSTPLVLGGARAELDRELLKVHRALER
jgi:dienelactone hydrolase